MNTIKVECKQAKMIAHRGLSGIERENTNAAFIAAGNRSYFGIETDVHKSADGQFVIIHDENTLRVSEGSNDINVEAQPYSAVASLCLPDKSGRIRGDLKIPTLSEYIRICKQYEKACVLELKNVFQKEDIIKIIEIIREEEYLENVIFISFSLENCKIVRELLPHQQIQWLLNQEITEQVLVTLIHYGMGIDTHYAWLDQEKINRLHEEGILVNAWTCDDQKIAQKLIDAGVDFITTNILE